MAGATGRPKASRKHVAEPSRSTRAPAWKGSTWRAQCPGLRSTAAPRPTSRTVRRTRAERAASSATAAAASARPPRAARPAGRGGCRRRARRPPAIIVRPETVSNEASAQSVPASAGHVASSQLAPGQRHADGVAAARGEHAAQARAADVPRARAPARDLGPRRREHAAPGDAPRDLPADVEHDGKHQPPDLGAGGSEHGANHSPARGQLGVTAATAAASARTPGSIAGSAMRP